MKLKKEIQKILSQLDNFVIEEPSYSPLGLSESYAELINFIQNDYRKNKSQQHIISVLIGLTLSLQMEMLFLQMKSPKSITLIPEEVD